MCHDNESLYEFNCFAQVSILSMTLKRLFLTGPPGGGKTLLLLLKAAQWVEKKGHVVILNLHAGSKGLPLGHQFEKQVPYIEPYSLFVEFYILSCHL